MYYKDFDDAKNIYANLIKSDLKKSHVADFKSKVNRLIEKEWDDLVKSKCLGLTTDPLVSELYWINTPMLHTIKSAIKKVDKLRKDFPGSEYSHMLDTASKNLISYKEYAEMHDNLKSAQETKVVTKVEPPKTSDELIKTLPPASRKSIKRVKDLLSNRCKDLQTSLENDYKDQFQQFIDEFMEYPEKQRKSVKMYQHYSGREAVLSLVRRFVQNGEILPNVEEKKAKMAKESAEMVVAKYVFKQTSKLAGIFEKMGNVDAIKLDIDAISGNVEGNMKLAFEDGRSFDLRSKIVISVNSNATWYERYPSTFHNITDSNGRVEAKMMSEHEINDWAEGKSQDTSMSLQ